MSQPMQTLLTHRSNSAGSVGHPAHVALNERQLKQLGVRGSTALVMRAASVDCAEWPRFQCEMVVLTKHQWVDGVCVV